MSTALATWLALPSAVRALLLLAWAVAIAGPLLARALRVDPHSLRVGWPCLLVSAVSAAVLVVALGVPELAWLPAGATAYLPGSSVLLTPLVVWPLVSGLLLMRLLSGVLIESRASRRAPEHPAAQVQEQFTALRQAIAPHAHHRVLSTADVALCAGLWRPRIMLPASAGDWSVPHLRAVLVHELVHARRLDTWLLVLVAVGEALLWPLWWCRAVGRRWQEALEASCDADAVIWLGDGDSYAEALVNAARPAPVRQRLLAMLGGERLRERIVLVLRGHRRGDLATAPIYWSSVTMVMVAITLAGLSAAPQQAGGDAFDTLHNIDLRAVQPWDEVLAPPPWLQTIEAMRPEPRRTSRPQRIPGPGQPPSRQPRASPD